MIVLPSIAITSPTELLELLMPFLAVGCLILSLRLLSSLRAFQAFGMLIRMDCWRHDAFYHAHASYVSWSHPGLGGSGNILS